jgi:GNAT superfamily N-acetyltransferase
MPVHVATDAPTLDSTVGVDLLKLDESVPHVQNIGVHPDYQGRGIGRAMMEMAVRGAESVSEDYASAMDDAAQRYACHLTALDSTVSIWRARDAWARVECRWTRVLCVPDSSAGAGSRSRDGTDEYRWIGTRRKAGSRLARRRSMSRTRAMRTIRLHGRWIHCTTWSRSA